MSPDHGFFHGLPARKAIVRTGYCEPVEGDMHNSVVVNIDESCVAAACAFDLCHMFEAIHDGGGNIIGRKFKSHPPEYSV